MSTIDGTVAADAWHSDFFGTVNEMPPEPVDLIATVLEAMGTEPGFQLARRTLIGDLGLGPSLLGDVLMGRDRAAVSHRLHRYGDAAPVAEMTVELAEMRAGAEDAVLRPLEGRCTLRFGERVSAEGTAAVGGGVVQGDPLGVERRPVRV